MVFYLLPGIPHGHTGHVRILTCVETSSPSKPDPRPKVNRYSLKSNKNQQNNINRGKLLVISGGDGYEDFKEPQASVEQQAGREDSTSHLLLWKVWCDLVRPSVSSLKIILFYSNILRALTCISNVYILHPWIQIPLFIMPVQFRVINLLIKYNILLKHHSRYTLFQFTLRQPFYTFIFHVIILNITI